MSNVLVGKAIKISKLNNTILPLLLTLVHIGSAIGNAISLQNTIMVKSVVNQTAIKYVKIFEYNLFVVSIYATLIILLSLLFIGQ
jgi:lactate permease